MFFCLCCCHLFGVFAGTDAVKSVSVTEGDSVTLNTSLTETQKEDLILWKFGNDRSLVAKINREFNEISTCNSTDGRFRDRLKLDHQTGSLIITNTRTTDSGLYEVTIRNSSSETKYRFSVTVYAPLPVPVISGNSTQNSSSSSSYCSLLCSVVNVGHVTLSWYKGNSLLSSISVSDLSISLSLPLEVDCVDDTAVLWLIHSPTRPHTSTTLNSVNHVQIAHSVVIFLKLCLDWSSLLVGVAAAFIMVYDFTSRKDEK